MTKGMDKWYNWLLGPTGTFDSGTKLGQISGQGFNPGAYIASGEYDWKKAARGGKAGFNIGGSVTPGWGHAIGSLVGAGVGGTFVGNPDESNSGLAAAATGKAEGDWWEGGNEPWKYINTAVGMRGSGGPYMGAISGQIGNKNKYSWYDLLKFFQNQERNT